MNPNPNNRSSRRKEALIKSVSQRDSIIQPRVASTELPWENHPEQHSTLKGLHPPIACSLDLKTTDVYRQCLKKVCARAPHVKIRVVQESEHLRFSAIGHESQGIEHAM